MRKLSILDFSLPENNHILIRDAIYHHFFEDIILEIRKSGDGVVLAGIIYSVCLDALEPFNNPYNRVRTGTHHVFDLWHTNVQAGRLTMAIWYFRRDDQVVFANVSSISSSSTILDHRLLRSLSRTGVQGVVSNGTRFPRALVEFRGYHIIQDGSGAATPRMHSVQVFW